MKKRLILTVEKEIADHAKALAKSQGISLSELISRKFEALDEDLLTSQLAASRFLERLKNDPPLPPQEKSDKEMRHDYLVKKYGAEEQKVRED
jgi:hypothetical protein